MPKGLWVKLCLMNLTNLTILVKHNLTVFVKYNLTILFKHNLTIFVKHNLTEFVKHNLTMIVKHNLTIIVKHGLTIFVNIIFGTPDGTHSPFHLQLCFLYINFCVVNRFTNGSPSDCLLPQASCNYTKSNWLSHDIHPWSPFRQARGTK